MFLTLWKGVRMDVKQIVVLDLFALQIDFSRKMKCWEHNL